MIFTVIGSDRLPLHFAPAAVIAEPMAMAVGMGKLPIPAPGTNSNNNWARAEVVAVAISREVARSRKPLRARKVWWFIMEEVKPNGGNYGLLRGARKSFF